MDKSLYFPGSLHYSRLGVSNGGFIVIAMMSDCPSTPTGFEQQQEQIGSIQLVGVQAGTNRDTHTHTQSTPAAYTKATEKVRR